MMNIPVNIYAEATPNPETIKFVANKNLFDGNIEYLSPEQAKTSPFISQLFDFNCVKSVFLSGNFVSITKTADSNWDDIVPILREFIRSYLSSDEALKIERQEAANLQDRRELSPKEETELEVQIREILNEYVKPAVEQDGGAIDLKSFKDGVVTVTLRGSCSGCPSSTITLKAGIENLLKRMVPEVSEVVSEAV